MKTILLIEDDELLGQGLVAFFTSHQFKCLWATNAVQAKKLWYKADVIILDRQLNDGDSLQHLAQWLLLKAVPVIVLTAKIEVEQRIEGLMAGAKDYVTKPFSSEELLARVLTQLRPLGSSLLTYENIELDLGQRVARVKQQNIALKPKEFQLLLLLVQNQGRDFHRDELLNKNDTSMQKAPIRFSRSGDGFVDLCSRKPIYSLSAGTCLSSHVDSSASAGLARAFSRSTSE